MFDTIVKALMGSYLATRLYNNYYERMIEHTIYGSDVDYRDDGTCHRTLQLWIMTRSNFRSSFPWIVGVLGMDATAINEIAKVAADIIDDKTRDYYKHVLDSEDGYYHSLGFKVTEKRDQLYFDDLKSHAEKVILNIFSDIYQALGIKLIIEPHPNNPYLPGKVVGLKKIDIDDAERKIFHIYKESKDEIYGEDYDLTRVYPFKRIKNRLKFFREH